MQARGTGSRKRKHMSFDEHDVRHGKHEGQHDLVHRESLHQSPFPYSNGNYYVSGIATMNAHLDDTEIERIAKAVERRILPCPIDLAKAHRYKEMPNPTPEEVESDPLFQAIWEVVKSWDVNVPEYYSGYCGANGSHVALILNAIKQQSQSGM